MVTSKKHSSAKDKPSSLSGKDKVSNGRENGEGLVGSRIRVWWPIDRKFYEGVVDSFDSSKKKHRVLYDDGDEEDLDMKKERWELIEEDSAKAEEDESANESSDATPELKKAKSNGKSSEKGRTDEAIPKKKQKIDSSAKSKSNAKSGKKSEDGEGVSEKPKGGVKKVEKSKDEAKQIPTTVRKPETERNRNLGDVGGKIVAAASRMSGRFQSKENGQEKETPKVMKSSKKISESKNPKQNRQCSPSSDAVSEKVKKPMTSPKKSKNTDDEDGNVDSSDDESKPLLTFLKKTPEATKALMEKRKRKKEKEGGEEGSGNEADAVEKA